MNDEADTGHFCDIVDAEKPIYHVRSHAVWIAEDK